MYRLSNYYNNLMETRGFISIEEMCNQLCLDLPDVMEEIPDEEYCDEDGNRLNPMDDTPIRDEDSDGLSDEEDVKHNSEDDDNPTNQASSVFPCMCDDDIEDFPYDEEQEEEQRRLEREEYLMETRGYVDPELTGGYLVLLPEKSDK